MTITSIVSGTAHAIGVW